MLHGAPRESRGGISVHAAWLPLNSFFWDYTGAESIPAAFSGVDVRGLLGRIAHEGADSFGHIAPDIQVPVFHGRIVAVVVDARPDSVLYALADRPVLAVDQLPEIHRIRRIEGGLRDFVGLEQKVAGNIGALGAAG